jgi:recombinational DNA repair protein (RecF pathway)
MERGIKDVGFITLSTEVGEGDVLLWVFTQNHGLLHCITKNYRGQKRKNLFLYGNFVEIENVGLGAGSPIKVSVEPLVSYATLVCKNSLCLLVLSTACELVNNFCVVQNADGELFASMHKMLVGISGCERAEFVGRCYNAFEAAIVKSLGLQTKHLVGFGNDSFTNLLQSTQLHHLKIQSFPSRMALGGELKKFLDT